MDGDNTNGLPMSPTSHPFPSTSSHTRHGRARIADQNVDGAHLVLDGLEGGGEL